MMELPSEWIQLVWKPIADLDYWLPEAGSSFVQREQMPGPPSEEKSDTNACKLLFDWILSLKVGPKLQ